MCRTTRSEMTNIIRKGHHNGVALFDAAEAHGPFEVKRILAEAIVPSAIKL